MDIIAELCQNHNGDTDILEKMIESASKNANIVKIQTIKADTLTKRSNYEEYRPFDGEYKRLRGLELDVHTEKLFVQLCKENGVESMTTLFTPDHIERFNEVGYDHLKLSGYSIPYFQYGKLLEKINFKKFFFSTSSLTLEEIEKTVSILNDLDIDYTMLQCTCIYPTPLNKSNLQNIPFFKNVLGVKKVGFSDHSNPYKDGLLVTKLAIFEGIDGLERHYTILEADKTRDGKVSVNETMLKELKRFSELSKKDQYQELNIFNKEQIFNHDYYRGRFK
jgi:N,N'-diacetyllegionaminate synthase